MNNTSTLMKDIMETMCNCYYDNYLLYERFILRVHKVCTEVYQRYSNQIQTMEQEFLDNFINTASLEYIWVKENQNTKAVSDYIGKMQTSFGLNQKFQSLIQQLNTEFYDQEQALIQEFVLKKLPGRDQMNDSPLQASVKMPNLRLKPLTNITFSIKEPSDSISMIVDEFFSNTTISRKWKEHRKSKVTQSMIATYNQELNLYKDEMIANIKQALKQLEESMKEYLNQMFFRTNRMAFEQIPEEILKLEVEITKLSIGDDTVKLYPYISKNNQVDYWAGRYANKIKGLLNQEEEAILHAWKKQYLNPYCETITKQVQLQMEKSDVVENTKQLLKPVTFLAEVKELKEQVPFIAQIEFGTIEKALVFEVNAVKQKLSLMISERYLLKMEAGEKRHEEQILIGIKALNDIAYRKFYHMWTASVKEKMKKLILEKNFLGLPAENNYELFFLQRKAYLPMETKEFESLEEVFEYRVNQEPLLARYQYLSVVDTRAVTTLKTMVSEEIRQYLAKLERVRLENQNIWDSALRMYLKEYADYVMKTKIEPVWLRLQGNLRKEWELYVEQEYLRHNFKPMDFTKYVGAYGKIDNQVLELIFGNEKAFPLNHLSTFHWSDKRAVTSFDFEEFHRKLKEQWLLLKQECEKR